MGVHELISHSAGQKHKTKLSNKKSAGHLFFSPVSPAQQLEVASSSQMVTLKAKTYINISRSAHGFIQVLAYLENPSVLTEIRSSRQPTT